jgi:hypothetical protein
MMQYNDRFVLWKQPEQNARKFNYMLHYTLWLIKQLDNVSRTKPQQI